MLKNTLSHSQAKSLPEWLSYIENIHSVEIDLGLDRIKRVAERLSIHFDFAKVITVAGTNGKGTTCAFIENALLKTGVSVAVYSSPHIQHFNERLRVNKKDIDDQKLITAFELIEQQRGDISLSYYEFTTLAAFVVLQEIKPEYIILEVGLGGRLDATNMIDADIAVITTIDLDHQTFLGNTREAIAFEKSGIMRPNKVAVVGDLSPPQTLVEQGENISARVKYRQQDFHVTLQDEQWQWRNEKYNLTCLVMPHIPQDNVATALQVLDELDISLDTTFVNDIIDKTKVAGRTERFELSSTVVLDVAHNPQAARYLAQYLQRNPYIKVHAVVGMLIDKDISGTLAPLMPLVSQWYLADIIDVPRAAKTDDIAQYLDVTHRVEHFKNVTIAFNAALKEAKENELVLVFGSFYTVAAVRSLLIS